MQRKQPSRALTKEEHDLLDRDERFSDDKGPRAVMARLTRELNREIEKKLSALNKAS